MRIDETRDDCLSVEVDDGIGRKFLQEFFRTACADDPSLVQRNSPDNRLMRIERVDRCVNQNHACLSRYCIDDVEKRQSSAEDEQEEERTSSHESPFLDECAEVKKLLQNIQNGCVKIHTAIDFQRRFEYVQNEKCVRNENVKSEFERFVEIAWRLRKECPWDREQTHGSIRHSLIEETYEVVEAIDTHNGEELKKELGDLLYHVVFHSVIAEQEKEFTLRDVIQGISEKLIRRHPHVFGDVKADTAHEVKKNWEKLKLQEGRQSAIEGVPKELPALLRAHRLQDKASKVGFDWERKEDAWKKVEEEVRELHRAIEHNDAAQTEAEFGDLLFALVNYSRFIGVNPENALRQTAEKFSRRFQYIEEKLRARGKDIHGSTLEEMDELWEESKKFLL